MPITGRETRLVPKRDQFPRDDVRRRIRLSERHQFLERLDRVTLGAQIERDEVRLPVRKDGHGRRSVHKMAAIVNLGQSRLDGAVAAIDDQHLRAK